MCLLIPTTEVSSFPQLGHRQLYAVLPELCGGKAPSLLAPQRRGFIRHESIKSPAHPALSGGRLLKRNLIQIHVWAFLRGRGQTGSHLLHQRRAGGASVATANAPGVAGVR